MSVIRKCGRAASCAMMLTLVGGSVDRSPPEAACNPADDESCLCVVIGCGPLGGQLCAIAQAPGYGPVFCFGWEWPE